MGKKRGSCVKCSTGIILSVDVLELFCGTKWSLSSGTPLVPAPGECGGERGSRGAAQQPRGSTRVVRWVLLHLSDTDKLEPCTLKLGPHGGLGCVSVRNEVCLRGSLQHPALLPEFRLQCCCWLALRQRAPVESAQCLTRAAVAFQQASLWL